MQLYIEVTDADFASSDELVDIFAIDIAQLPVGVETLPKQYNGTYNFSSITLSFEVKCLIANFFPNCVANNCESFRNCTCLPGYVGPDCNIDVDDCAGPGVRCPEGRVCVDRVNGYSCECTQGYSGDNCTLRGEDDCWGVDCGGSNGVCVDDIDSYRCVCNSGYAGEHCETGS